jgi:hypothetical protein
MHPVDASDFSEVESEVVTEAAGKMMEYFIDLKPTSPLPSLHRQRRCPVTSSNPVIMPITPYLYTHPS